MAGVSAKLDASVMIQRFNAAEPKIKRAVSDKLNRLGLLTASRLKAAAPRASSNMANKIHSINGSANNPTVQVVADAKYTTWVDKGTKPHPVSAEGQAALASWVVTKHLNLGGATPESVAFLIARSIGKKGTKAANFIDPVITPAKAEAIALMKGLLGEVKI
jgi:hypothetical protein